MCIFPEFSYNFRISFFFRHFFKVLQINVNLVFKIFVTFDCKIHKKILNFYYNCNWWIYIKFSRYIFEKNWRNIIIHFFCNALLYFLFTFSSHTEYVKRESILFQQFRNFSFLKVVLALWRFLMDFCEISRMLLILPLDLLSKNYLKLQIFRKKNYN